MQPSTPPQAARDQPPSHVRVAFRIVLGVSLTVGLVYAPLNYLNGDFPGALVNLGVFAVVCLVTLYYRLSGNWGLALNIIATLACVGFAAQTQHQGGLYAPTVWWFVVVPVLLLACDRLRDAMLWALVACVLIVWLAARAGEGRVDLAELPAYQPAYYASTVIGLFVFLTVFQVWVARSRTAAERRLRATTEALQRANAELVETRDRAVREAAIKTRLMANISHELRTPLNSMSGSLQLLEHGVDAQRQRVLVGMFRDGARHLGKLVDDILDFSKLEAGELGIASEPCDLRALVASVVDVVRDDATRRGLTLAADVAADVPHWVCGDPRRIRQVLFNLVGNALKFTERGTITLTVAARTTPSAQVCIRVCDTGIGIAPEALEDVFEPFRQLDDSFTRAADGSGLGLAICRDLARLMGGHIEVASSPGEGSEFSFAFPLAVSAAPAAEDASAVPFAPSMDTQPAGLRVLLAEDNADNRRLARDMLELLEQPCDVAADGVEALEAARRTPYALIFMDCRMPRLDGLAATRAIREFEAVAGRPRARIVALTGDALEENRAQCRAAGMDTLIKKPYELDELAAELAIVRAGAAPRGSAL